MYFFIYIYISKSSCSQAAELTDLKYQKSWNIGCSASSSCFHKARSDRGICFHLEGRNKASSPCGYGRKPENVTAQHPSSSKS